MSNGDRITLAEADRIVSAHFAYIAHLFTRLEVALNLLTAEQMGEYRKMTECK